jgi:hypothetical protein
MKKIKYSLILFLFLGLLTSCFKNDQIKPLITLKGRSIVVVPVGQNYIEPGFVAQDDRDGDISYLVKRSSLPPTDSAGLFLIRYNVIDASGNEAKEVIRKLVITQNGSTVSGVFKASDSCQPAMNENNTYFISALAGTNENFSIAGYRNLSPEFTIKAKVLGNTGQELFIPDQIINDTLYYGSGSISATGQVIDFLLVRSLSNIFKDSCRTQLVKYIQ